MSEKWTKEQIKTAKKYLKKGNCDEREDCSSCLLYKNKKCIVGWAEVVSDKKMFAIIIAQHEHDADEQNQQREQSNSPNDTKIEQINLPVGMSIHDYWRYQFAGMALQGLLADSTYNDSNDNMIKNCILNADNLLKQLEQ